LFLKLYLNNRTIYEKVNEINNIDELVYLYNYNKSKSNLDKLYTKNLIKSGSVILEVLTKPELKQIDISNFMITYIDIKVNRKYDSRLEITERCKVIIYNILIKNNRLIDIYKLDESNTVEDVFNFIIIYNNMGVIHYEERGENIKSCIYLYCIITESEKHLYPIINISLK